MTPLPWLPYGRQEIDEADIRSVVDVLRGDWLTTGPAVEAFEAALSAVAGGAPCVTVTSGTAALHTAYAALAVGKGDEVVTTPFTFVATASSAALHGASITFVDVSDDTLNLDPEAVAAAASSRTRVVAAVDYAGHPADLDALRKISDAADAYLLEDAAHSIGGAYRGRAVGSIADVTCFSFFPTKHLTTAEGGAVASIDPELERRARRFARIGRAEVNQQPNADPWWYEMHEFGLNYRLPDVLCALGVSQLRRLPRFLQRRSYLVGRYNKLLADQPGVRLPVARQDVEPAWHLYSVRILDGRRREVFDRLRAQNIGVQVNYIPVYWHPVFRDAGYQRGLCPVAEMAYEQQLSLPLFPTMSESDQDRVIEALVGILGS